MKINHILGYGFKGRSFNQKLKNVTLIYGGNWVGKTAHIQALTLALAGYVPEVGKTARAVYDKFASDSEMVVEIDGDGFAITRTYRKEGDSVKSSVRQKGLPDDFSMPPVALDASEYFSLSEVERTKFIFARVGSGVSVQNLATTLLANVKNIKLEENTPDTEAAVQDAVGELNNAFEAAITDGQAVQALVEELVKDFKVKLNEATAIARRMDTTVQGLTQVAACDEQAPANVEQKMARARATLDEQTTALGQAAGNASRARLDLNSTQTRAAQKTDEQATLTEIERLSAEKAVAQAVTQPQPFDQTKVVPDETTAAQLAEMGQRKAVLFTATQEPKPDLRELRQKKDAWQTQWNRTSNLHGQAKALVERFEAELAATKAEENCSKCGQSLEVLKAQVIAMLKDKIDGSTAALHSAQLALDSVTATLTAAKTELQTAEDAALSHERTAAEYRLLENDTLQLRNKVERKARALWDDQNNAYLEAQRTVNRLTDKITNLRAKLEDKTAATAAEQIPALEEAVGFAELAQTQAQAKKADLTSEIAQLEAQHRELMKQRGEAATRQGVIDEAAKAKASATVLKEVCSLLAEAQSALVANAITPLMNRVNQICGAVLPNALSYDAESGEIGFKLPRGFVTHKSMSGAERALTYLSINIALASDAPFKLAILDELNRLDAKNKVRFVRHLCGLVKDGVIDQALLVDTNADAFKIEQPFSIVDGVAQGGKGKMIVDPALVALGFDAVELV